MRALLVVVLALSALTSSALPSSAQAQGAAELGAPRAPADGTTPEGTAPEGSPETESVDPTIAPNVASPAPSAPSTSPEAAAPPPGAPSVPPGYEGATPSQPAYGQPAYGQPAYGQPAYGQPAYGQPPSGPAQPIPTRTRIRLRDGMEVPPYARVYERRLGFLMWPGLGIFVGSYAVSSILAIDGGAAAIPIAGPLIWQAQHGSSGDLDVTIPLTILQVFGVVAFSIGAKKRRYAEYWRVGDQPVPPPGRQFSLAPYADRHGGGISLMVY